MARDCPNQGSRGGRSGGRSGGGSSGSSPWATGANAAPRGTGRSTPSSNNKSVNDDWGLSGSDLASSTGATGSASDPWGTSTKSSKSLDDWGSSSRSVSSRSGRSTAVAPPSSFSSESWDSEAPIKAASSDTADPWGDEPPGTTPRSRYDYSYNSLPILLLFAYRDLFFLFLQFRSTEFAQSHRDG